jgi:hypothetical protein
MARTPSRTCMRMRTSSNTQHEYNRSTSATTTPGRRILANQRHHASAGNHPLSFPYTLCGTPAMTLRVMSGFSSSTSSPSTPLSHYLYSVFHPLRHARHDLEGHEWVLVKHKEPVYASAYTSVPLSTLCLAPFHVHQDLEGHG